MVVCANHTNLVEAGGGAFNSAKPYLSRECHQSIDDPAQHDMLPAVALERLQKSGVLAPESTALTVALCPLGHPSGLKEQLEPN